MNRIGIGWDIHGLVAGRPLWLGTVRFDDADRGLEGHSDADVVSHAIVDAILGAAGMGDIGEHFPDSDPAYKDYPGDAFLRDVCRMIGDRFNIVNVDCTVMSDAVRLDKRKHEMRDAIAGHLGVDSDRVNVKATTWEGFGPVGRGEIIACQAIALLEARG